jgi:hypothetical protein
MIYLLRRRQKRATSCQTLPKTTAINANAAKTVTIGSKTFSHHSKCLRYDHHHFQPDIFALTPPQIIHLNAIVAKIIPKSFMDKQLHMVNRSTTGLEAVYEQCVSLTTKQLLYRRRTRSREQLAPVLNKRGTWAVDGEATL